MLCIAYKDLGNERASGLVASLFVFVIENWQELKESKRRKRSNLRSPGSNENSESPNSKGVQLSITEFYRSTKVQFHANQVEDPANNSENCDDGISKVKRKLSSSNLSKSARRRLLFQ